MVAHGGPKATDVRGKVSLQLYRYDTANFGEGGHKSTRQRRE